MQGRSEGYPASTPEPRRISLLLLFLLYAIPIGCWMLNAYISYRANVFWPKRTVLTQDTGVKLRRHKNEVQFLTGSFRWRFTQWGLIDGDRRSAVGVWWQAAGVPREVVPYLDVGNPSLLHVWLACLLLFWAIWERADGEHVKRQLMDDTERENSVGPISS